MKNSSVSKWLRIIIPTVLIATWMLIGAIGGPYFGKIEEVSEIDLTAFLPTSAEATKVNEEVKKFRDEKTIPAVVVFESKAELTAAQIESLNRIGQTIEKVDGIDGDVAPAIVSDDKKAAFIVAPVNSGESIPDVIDGTKSALNDAGLSGINYKVTGPAGAAADLTKAFAGIDGILLLTALAVVFIILVVVYRSALLPIVVLMTSILALSASIFVVWTLAKANIVQLNGQVQGILFILVIGAATDYSLLYVSRYREALYQFKSKYDATISALKGSVEPILASGGTVIVGLLCLLLSDLASNKALGPVGSIGIISALLASLTFLPATLYLFGRTSFWPIRPLADKKSAEEHKAKLQGGFWHKVGTFVERRQRLIWIVTSIALLIAALYSTQIKAEGVAQSDLILGTSEARDGQKILSKYFPDGSGSPALIIIPENKLSEIATKAESVKGVESVSVVAEGVPAGFKPLGQSEKDLKADIKEQVQIQFDAQLAQLDSSLMSIAEMAGPEAAATAREQAVATMPSLESLVDEIYPFKAAIPKAVDEEVLLQATLTDAPDSNEAKQTIIRLREAVKSIDSAILVGGSTAVQLDTNTASIRDRFVIIPVVLIAITLILMLLLRSIIAPLLLLLSTVLSFASALGVAALLFNNVLGFPGADPSVILFAFVFLVALGIDYNIFLMTRVREEAIKQGTSKGIIKGLVVTGGVITSAGIVLAATFAALGVIPILFLFQLAFIVAFGVLLDTFVVRSLLVPALLRDIGSFIWWPSKLKNKP